ncbi:hypothetical protein [Serratia marcescens]|uniref:MrpH family fimbial adhesin n=1 Tax=Serratia marcescens TaxID=615 RepID=UPI003204ADB1
MKNKKLAVAMFLSLLFPASALAYANINLSIFKNWSWDGQSSTPYYMAMISDWFGADDRPNPCYQASSCDLGFQLYQWTNGEDIFPGKAIGSAIWLTSGSRWARADQNIGEMGKSFRRNFDFPVQRTMITNPTEPGINTYYVVCLMYRVNGGGPRIFYETCASNADSGGGGGGGTWCKAYSQDVLNFNYGPVNSEEINGKTKSVNYSVWCNRDSTAKIYTKSLTNGRLYLRADNSLYSDLTIKDRDLSTGIKENFSEGITKSYTIKSTLGSVSEVSPGTFNGSTIIYIDIQ